MALGCALRSGVGGSVLVVGCLWSVGTSWGYVGPSRGRWAFGCGVCAFELVGRCWSYVGPSWGYVGPSRGRGAFGFGVWVCSGVRLVVCTLGFGVGGLGLVGRGLCCRVWGMCCRVGRSVLGVDGL